MSRMNWNELLNDDERPARKRDAQKPAQSGPHRGGFQKLDELIRYRGMDQIDADQVFNPTFHSSRHEREWILSYLGPFYEDDKILDVLRMVKGGKEATVYCCAAHPDLERELVAAKIYRPREFRSLRKDYQYRQGRAILDAEGKVVRDGRMLRAVRKGTQVGKEMQHTAWLQSEYQTLELLFAVGADVPEPLAFGDNTILMEYFGELDLPAPLLSAVSLRPREARLLYDRLLHDVEVMLACRRVHGDLSAYNVLYWEGDIRLIDFPQAIDPLENRDAYAIFQRDLLRLCQYFQRYGLGQDPARLARELWLKYGFTEGANDEQDAE
ncbi:MAG TPA: RIO1 family regulatory kinase/ATPase [Anaerolineaceae bacterium]|nr:RIO1 family regulatory kinase/ATPase [Anaerolineaceae bacterium]